MFARANDKRKAKLVAIFLVQLTKLHQFIVGRTIQSRYAEAPPFVPAPGHHASRRIEWDTLSPDAQKALEIELKLLSIILDTQALPVWLGVTSVSEPDLTASQEMTATVSEEWIDESLTFAQFDLDDHEEWVRSLLAQDSPN